MTSRQDDTLFDAQAVAAQILAQPVPHARRSDDDAPAQGEATADGRLPDTLSDRGNAKLFVKLY
ncbi:hypothetical protein TN53_40775, partial [Streptomyces sp. WM6386]